MENDDDFAPRVRDAGGPEQSLEVLAADGFVVTADELTQEQLDAMVGGINRDDAGWLVAAGGALAAGAGAAAAAAAI